MDIADAPAIVAEVVRCSAAASDSGDSVLTERAAAGLASVAVDGWALSGGVATLPGSRDG
ncbi:hypothetical protein [Goodfellowiella coeruleoviolacea]|uniref:hypothetical protein n=1 Tax=Goodfellowiella coeruleoviolacea TaxID=334858 RepID=UPI0020A3908A|nr:hypothetical protein [Goodfellowiella coeruleoviolacea]